MEKKPFTRRESVRVKSARGRTTSSVSWLQRQLNDPYVARAKAEGYRSRATYKLKEMDAKFHLLKAGQTVIDLGAAPGGWTQYAAQKVLTKKGDGNVIGIDLTPIEPIPGVELIQGDFLDDAMPEQLQALCADVADVVMSDMAAPACGHNATDHIRIMALCEAAFEFAQKVLKPGGAFVAKLLRGGAEAELHRALHRYFQKVHYFKPPASRQDSAEIYVVATGFREP